MRPRVLLLRESAQQMSSSGCCGRIEGDAAVWGPGGSPFPERRAEMERAGEIYRRLRRHFGDAIELQVIDPRNIVAWLPMAVADMWRFRRSLRPLPALLAGLRTSAVVVNGALLFQGLPDAPAVVAAVERVVVEGEQR